MQNVYTCNASTLYIQSANQKLKCLALSAPKIWPGPQNVEMSHETLTTPNWGIVKHHKTNTSCGQVAYEI